MITLPDYVEPSDAVPGLIDFGVTLRPATGGDVQKVERPGSRYRIQVILPPMEPEQSSVVISRLIEAKRKGELRIPFPLLGRNQGSPGAAVVDGAGQQGTSIALRNMTPGHLFKEGYWITLVDATGQRYLYNVRSTIPVGADGRVTLTIEPPLRNPHLDGATCLAAKPEIEGFIDGGEWTWSIGAAGVTGISFTIEEAA